MILKSKLTVKKLRVFCLMVSGRYEGNKSELIERILKHQKDHEPVKILVETEKGFEINPNLDFDQLPVEYDSYHQAMQMN